MSELGRPKTVKHQWLKFVPKSEIQRVARYVYYDSHPRDDKKLDIIICTVIGEVKEFYKQKLVSSLKIDGECYFKSIKTLRNGKGELFYLVQLEDELIILSRNKELKIFKRFKSVKSYVLIDLECTGDLQLVLLRDAQGGTVNHQHVSVDNELKMEHEATDCLESVDTTPITRELNNKLNEVKYIMQSNKRAHKQIIELTRQVTENNVVPLKILNPMVRLCNKKIVILIEVENTCNEPIAKLSALLHNTGCNSISYITKLFKYLAASPYYEEMENLLIESHNKSWVAVVIPIKEFKNLSNVSDRIDFNIVLSYEIHGKSCSQVSGSVSLSASDVMGNSFDVFNTVEISESIVVLSMLATTEKSTLWLKQIDSNTPELLVLLKLFCDHLNVELLAGFSNVAIQKQSPHHLLNGIMIIFHPNMGDPREAKNNFQINVYARSQFQVRALIYFITSIPHKFIVFTPNIRVTPKTACKGDLRWDYYSDTQRLHFSQCSASLLKQLSLTEEYLEDCRSKTKSSSDINIFATGFDKFSDYRDEMLAEFDNCVEILAKSKSQRDDSEVMAID